MHGWAIAATLVTLGLASGCSLFRESYPPAYPAPKFRFDPHKPYVFTKAPPPKDFCPPPVVTVRNPLGIPSPEEWRTQWQLKPIPHRVCRGTGAKRRCVTKHVPATATDQANHHAILRATPWHTRHGTSGRVRYPFHPREDPVYEIVTSPREFTYLVLLEGERQATQMLLNPHDWEVFSGKSGGEGARKEVLTVRPVAKDNVPEGERLPPPTRAMLIYQSGLTKHLLFKAQERPGMISVEWVLSEEAKTPPPPPVEQHPPAFKQEDLYTGYTVTLESKKTLTPPWLPEAVADDGVNTLLKFRTAFEGVRLPLVSGVQQNGQPALVQSRLYVRPGHGSWIWVQGLWPALRLKDAAGITVKVVRHVPKSQEPSHEGKQM